MSARRGVLKLVLPLAVLALAAALVALLWVTRSKTEPQTAEVQRWPVRVVSVDPGPKRPEVTLYGHLESASTATLSAAVQGEILAVPAEEGRGVDAGELLVRIDDTDLRLLERQRQAQVRELSAQLQLERRQRDADQAALANERELLQLAQDEVTRVERLAEQGSASQSQLDNARQQLRQRQLSVIQRELSVDSYDQRVAQLRARLEQAEASLEQVRKDIERASVEAPYPARVAAVMVGPGARVRPGEPLIRLYNPGELQVRASLPGAHLAKVREALKGEGVAAAGRADGVDLDLTLRRLGGSTQTGQAGVEALFDVRGRHPDLVLGRFVTVTMGLPAEPGLIAVPYEAVYGNDRIYRLEGGEMRRVDVRQVGDTVASDGRRLALLRAPSVGAGDRIVATQIPQAANGVKVRVVEERARR